MYLKVKTPKISCVIRNTEFLDQVPKNRRHMVSKVLKSIGRVKTAFKTTIIYMHWQRYYYSPWPHVLQEIYKGSKIVRFLPILYNQVDLWSHLFWTVIKKLETYCTPADDSSFPHKWELTHILTISSLFSFKKWQPIYLCIAQNLWSTPLVDEWRTRVSKVTLWHPDVWCDFSLGWYRERHLKNMNDNNVKLSKSEESYQGTFAEQKIALLYTCFSVMFFSDTHIPDHPSVLFPLVVSSY